MAMIFLVVAGGARERAAGERESGSDGGGKEEKDWSDSLVRHTVSAAAASDGGRGGM